MLTKIIKRAFSFRCQISALQVHIILQIVQFSANDQMESDKNNLKYLKQTCEHPGQ